jgi:hypothetical protein
VAHLIILGLTLLLAGGFLVLNAYEATREGRYLEEYRARLDKEIKRLTFIVTHVDFAAFAREESQRLLGKASHYVAHLSLQAVREVEKVLTRVVRYLRVHHNVEVRPAAETREFVKTLSDFKERLKDTMPEMHPVQNQD